jgi:hypothetical protein
VAGILGAGIHHRQALFGAGILRWQASSGGRHFRVAGILLHWVGGFQDIGSDKRSIDKKLLFDGWAAGMLQTSRKENP